MTPGEALTKTKAIHEPLNAIKDAIGLMEKDAYMTSQMAALKHAITLFIDATTDIMQDVGDAAFDPEPEPTFSTSEFLREQFLWTNRTYYGITDPE